MKKLSLFVLSMVLVLAMATFVSALPQVDPEVEINGKEYRDGQRLEVNLGEDLEISVRVYVEDDGDDLVDSSEEDVEVEAWIAGYEHSNYGRLSDTSGTFDLDEGHQDYVDLELTVPEDIDKDDFDLRIFVAGRTGEAASYTFPLYIEGERNMVAIRDVVFTPEYEVMAGRALLTTVRVKNVGEKDEESVKVRVMIPELGISATDYIDEIEVDDSVTSEELYMRIPKAAEPGDYEAVVEVTFDDGYEKVTTKEMVTVSEGDYVAPVVQPEKTVLTIGPESQEVTAGETGVVYPITVANQGSAAKTYVITVSTTEDWADFDISPNNVLTVVPGETVTSYLYVSALPEAEVGTHTFKVTVKSGAETLKEVTLSATVVEAGAANGVGWDNVKRGLEIGLVVLVVLLVILGLVIGFSRLKGKEDEGEETEAGQTYY